MFEGVVGELSGGVGRRVAVAGGPVKGHGAVTWRREHSGVSRSLRRVPPSGRRATVAHSHEAPAPRAPNASRLSQVADPPPERLPTLRTRTVPGSLSPSGPSATALRHSHISLSGDSRAEPAPRCAKSEVSFVFKEDRSASVIKRMFSLIVVHIKRGRFPSAQCAHLALPI